MTHRNDSEEIGKVAIGLRLDDYTTFFDHDWSRNLLDDTMGTRLENPANGLCIDWKSAANALVLPWLFAHVPNNLYKGFAEMNPSWGVLMARALKERLVREVEMRSGLSNMKRKELQGAIDRILTQVEPINAMAPPEIQPEQVWASYLTYAEFALGLLGTQRLCYSAVYFGYENFLRRCVAEATNNPAYRPYRDDLKKDLNRIVKDLGDECMSDDAVVTAKLARDTLAHNGGMETDELKQRGHKFQVVEGCISPLPADIRELYSVLKAKVTRVVAETKSLPVFRKQEQSVCS
jgi:hypothetical protein